MRIGYGLLALVCMLGVLASLGLVLSQGEVGNRFWSFMLVQMPLSFLALSLISKAFGLGWIPRRRKIGTNHSD